MKLKKETNILETDNKKLLLELEAAKKRLAQYEYASAGASEGLWDRNLLTDEVFISPPWASMLGYEFKEIEQKVGIWEKLLHPEDAKKAATAFNDFISGNIAEYKLQFRLRHKKGHYLWVESTAKLTKDASGKPIRISGSHKDITERKQAEEKIQASEEKYKHFFQNSLIGMCRVRKSDLEVIEINKKALNILALPEAKRSMKITDPFLDADQKENFVSLLAQFDGVNEFEARFERWDESETWVAISAVKIGQNKGQYYDVIFRDITDFKENILELQRLNFELDNFVYHASHDIRSPLRSLMGLMEILKTENRPEEINKIIEMMSGSITRLDKFVVDLLAMSRDSRLSVPAVPVNFLVEVNNSVTNFHHVYATKGLEIRVKVKQNTPFYSDLTKVRIILNNLISNAIKYRKNDEGLLSFIDISAETNPKEAIFTIEDNGEGIPDDKLEKIFQMFYRASENSEGSGLGMYIVKNVVQKLNATIEVDSKEGKGTKFTVRIPNEYED